MSTDHVDRGEGHLLNEPNTEATEPDPDRAPDGLRGAFAWVVSGTDDIVVGARIAPLAVVAWATLLLAVSFGILAMSAVALVQLHSIGQDVSIIRALAIEETFDDENGRDDQVGDEERTGR